MIADSRRPHARRRSAVSTLALLGTAAFLAGCAIAPEPLTQDENVARLRLDLAEILKPQEPLNGPVSMHQAMARAIKYNLDERVKLMEMAIATRQLDLSRYDMLPQLAASAGFVGRNNEAGSESLNLATGRRTGESTTAVDRQRRTADLGLTWNVLDFGVSYLRARQNSNLVLIADERRRRVVQGILQDVRTAYWRAVAADRLLRRIEPLERRIEAARRDSGTIEALRVQSPLQALAYQRSLIDTLRQLQSLRRELAPSKSQLGALMGLPPGEPFALETPADADLTKAPSLKAEVDALETYALLNRPELLEESYNARISADETRRGLLKLLPGIDLNAGLRYDSNSFLVNQNWADLGARVSLNLVNLVSAPANRAFAEAQEELVMRRRQALSMAVLSQVRVAVLQYRELTQEFSLTADQAAIEERMRRQYVNVDQAGQQGELGVIQAEVTAALSALRRDLLFADLHNAYARLMVSVGVDPLPEVVPAADMATLTRAINEGLETWQTRASTALRLRDLAAPPSAAAPEPTAPAAPPPVAAQPAPVVEPVTTSNLVVAPVGGVDVQVQPQAVPPATAEATPPVAQPPVAPAPAAPAQAAQAPAQPAARLDAAAAYRVQLGAYATEEQANLDWRKLESKLGGLVTKYAPVYARSERISDGKAFVALRVAGFADQDEAGRFCKALQAKQTECQVMAVKA